MSEQDQAAEFAARLFGPPQQPEHPVEVERSEQQPEVVEPMESREEAAAFAAQLFGQPEQAAGDFREQPTGDLPSRDKPVSAWTEAESAAYLAYAPERILALRESREAEEKARIAAEAGLTLGQEHARLLAALGSPGVKRTLDLEWLSRLHRDPSTVADQAYREAMEQRGDSPT